LGSRRYVRAMILELVAAAAIAADAESLIRAARQEFNAAIVRRDSDAIARLLAPTYHLVTGRSDQSHGREAEREKWAVRFAADPTVNYVRMPRSIRANEAWGLAEEAGDWNGAYTTAGSKAVASGVYAAKWQRAADGRWLIQAEVFTTLSCEGATIACVPPESIAGAPASIPSSRAVSDLKVTVLSTMLTGSDGVGEWGFAALLESGGRRLLIDTGARPETVLRNADELKIDLSTITDLVLTHNHGDHTGGLIRLRAEMRKRNPAALSRAHVGAGIFEPRLRADGTDTNGLLPLRRAFEDLGGTFVVHDKPEELIPGVWITGPVPRVHPERNWSGAYKVPTASGGVIDDTVAEDTAIVVETKEGLVVITGCGHAGVVNISQFARKTFAGAPVRTIVGGLHLFNARDEDVAWTAARLRESGVRELLGAHCTGIEAVYRLRDLLGLSRRTAVVGAVGASFSLDKGIDATAIAK
jgi:7,8-dihydropterin-6-yl-methyl-4-(beta-D-ribofuranosyl)aminobenzene 5'-phosphate synthase